MPITTSVEDSVVKDATTAGNAPVKKGESSPSGGPIYTCPMHPEIQQTHSGACPKCGMTLELKTAKAGTDQNENAELRDMTKRFWIGAALALPVFVLAMAHLIPGAGQTGLGGRERLPLDAICAHHTGSRMGRVAVLPARLALNRNASVKYVHAYCHRRERASPERS